MIESNNKRAFNSKASTIGCSSFRCIVSTAKEGVFSGLSTMIALLDTGGPPRACAKVIYAKSLAAEERQQIHDYMIGVISEKGDNGHSLYDILSALFKELKDSGMVVEAMHSIIKPPLDLQQQNESFKEAKSDLLYIDHQNGLMWPKNGDIADEKMNWHDAMSWVKNLNYAGFDDWRLPAISELEKLIDRGDAHYLWLNAHGFDRMQRRFYWSSTLDEELKDLDFVCLAHTFGDNPAGSGSGGKSTPVHVWPVRDIIL